MSELESGTIVIVEWWDSSSPTSIWNGVADAKAYRPVKVITVGFLAHQDSERIVVFQSFHKDEVAGVFAIPRGSVIAMRELAGVEHD